MWPVAAPLLLVVWLCPIRPPPLHDVLCVPGLPVDSLAGFNPPPPITPPPPVPGFACRLPSLGRCTTPATAGPITTTPPRGARSGTRRQATHNMTRVTCRQDALHRADHGLECNVVSTKGGLCMWEPFFEAGPLAAADACSWIQSQQVYRRICSTFVLFLTRFPSSADLVV